LPNRGKGLQDLHEKILLLYRFLEKLMLRLPNPSFPFFVLRRFSSFEGIFCAVILPLFVFFSGILVLWLFPMASLAFGFPLNVVVTLLPTAMILVVFLRVQMERKISWWRSIFGPPVEWNASKSLDELTELFKKQQRSDRSSSVKR
jgi:hypothetical protein